MAMKLTVWKKRGLATSTNRLSEQCLTIRRLKHCDNWQNGVATRLPVKKTASIGKFRTSATKAIGNTRISLEGKRGMGGLKAD